MSDGATLRAMSTTSRPHVWTLTDAHAGNLYQARALGQWVGSVDHHIELNFPPPWRWLAPRGVPGAIDLMRLPRGATAPDIAIGCGRQSALALRALKRALGTFTVQILAPRIDTRHFDVVVTPAHDLLSGGNVMRSIGALNAIDADWLVEARAQFPELGELPRPLIGVVIGGPHRESMLTESALDDLLQRIAKRIAAVGGSLLVCGSRRTPAPWRPMLRTTVRQLGGQVWMDAQDGRNPYRGLLAHASQLVVTADSVNMLSEACAVGIAVTSFSVGAPTGKLARFGAALRQANLLSAWDQPVPPLTPLRETAGIAARIAARWQDSLTR